MAIEFHPGAIGDGHRAGQRDAPGVVAPEIEQHQMFGLFLGIGEQAGLVFGIFHRVAAARPGAGDRPDCHIAIAHPHEDFGAGADQREIRQIEEIQEG